MELRITERVGFRVAGSASAFPGPITSPRGTTYERVSNEAIFETMLGPDWRDKAKGLGLDPDYPEQVVGMKERFWTHWPGTPISHAEATAADLGTEACRKALAAAGVGPNDCDLFVLATTSPLKITSSTAGAIEARLAMEAPGIELKAGCSSGLYAFVTALSYIRMGARRVLVCAAETLSKFCPPGAREALFSVADGAGALVIEADDGGAELQSAMISMNGELGEKLVGTPGLLPPTVEAVEQGQYFYTGDPKGLKDTALQKYAAVFQAILPDAAVTPADLDLYLPHQVNLALIKGVAAAVGIPYEKVFVNIQQYGNFGSATLLVALHEALESGRLSRGSLAAMGVVGGGLTWGGAVIRF